MAFGNQTKRFCLILFVSAAACGQPFEMAATEKRLARNRPGILRLEGGAVTFAPAKGGKRRWTWDQIQRLEMTAEGDLHLVLYRDVWWQAERDQRLRFFSAGLKQQTGISAFLREKLGDRFLPRLAMPQGAELWRAPAKLLRGWGGPEGDLVLNEQGWQFLSPEPGQTLSIEDRLTANISSADPLELTADVRGAAGLCRFQLKEPLPQAVYDAWWRRLHRPRGLELIPASATSAGLP